MAVITRAYSETDGTTAEASSVNKVIDDLYTLQNGNLNSANLANSAVTVPKISGETLVYLKLHAQAFN